MHEAAAAQTKVTLQVSVRAGHKASLTTTVLLRLSFLEPERGSTSYAANSSSLTQSAPRPRSPLKVAAIAGFPQVSTPAPRDHPIQWALAPLKS